MSMGAEARIIDEAENSFCGFCSFQLLDSDGSRIHGCGTAVQAPLHLESSAAVPATVHQSAPGERDLIILEAEFVHSDPLFFLELRAEEGVYLSGQWCVGGPWGSKASTLLAAVLPVKTQTLCEGAAGLDEAMDVDVVRAQSSPRAMGGQRRFVDCMACCAFSRLGAEELPNLRVRVEALPLGLGPLRVARATLVVPRDVWRIHKEARLRIWRAEQNQPPEDPARSGIESGASISSSAPPQPPGPQGAEDATLARRTPQTDGGPPAPCPIL